MNTLKSTVKKIAPKNVKRFLNRIFYQGNDVYCPCCEQKFRKFLNYGTREAARCPNCNSFERHRLLWLYLKNKTNLFSANLKFLHVAPEEIFARVFQSLPNLDYISVDLESTLAMVKMDITDISYEDNSFDVIFCNHVFEHIPDDRKAMRELLRVLKSGGWAILQSPLDPSLSVTFEDFTITLPEARKKAFGQKDHVRIYGEDYKSRLEEAGFIVKLDSYVRDLDSITIKQYGLMSDEDIYLCTKPS